MIVFVGLLLYLTFSISIALAAPPEPEMPPATSLHPRWLVLDPARPRDEDLHLLLSALVQLKAEGVIEHFDSIPENSALRVVASPEVISRLNGLPGAFRVTPLSSVSALQTESINALSNGHITGTVTDGANLLPNIYVTAYRYNDIYGYWDWVSDATTNASGVYDISGLAAGTYRIMFQDSSDTYLGECYNDSPTLGNADDVAVTDGSTTSGIDAVLALAGHITGTVTDGVNALPGIYIDVSIYTGGGWHDFNGATTDASGTYDISGLRTGTYRVGFHDWSGT